MSRRFEGWLARWLSSALCCPRSSKHPLCTNLDIEPSSFTTQSAYFFMAPTSSGEHRVVLIEGNAGRALCETPPQNLFSNGTTRTQAHVWRSSHWTAVAVLSSLGLARVSTYIPHMSLPARRGRTASPGLMHAPGSHNAVSMHLFPAPLIAELHGGSAALCHPALLAQAPTACPRR